MGTLDVIRIKTGEGYMKKIAIDPASLEHKRW